MADSNRKHERFFKARWCSPFLTVIPEVRENKQFTTSLYHRYIRKVIFISMACTADFDNMWWISIWFLFYFSFVMPFHVYMTLTTVMRDWVFAFSRVELHRVMKLHFTTLHYITLRHVMKSIALYMPLATCGGTRLSSHNITQYLLLAQRTAQSFREIKVTRQWAIFSSQKFS